MCVYIYICMYVCMYIQIMTVTTDKPVRQNTDACSRTQKSEMETLSEALGRPAEQSQPPENLHITAMEKTEEKSLVPVRQQFVLSKTRYLSHSSPTLYSPRREAVIIRYIMFVLCPLGQRYTSIFSLMNACYLGFHLS